MKIFVTGTRGIPDIPGGVEKHCQELFPRVANKGQVVLIATRSSYITSKLNKWHDIRLISCFAPKKKSLEAIVHTTIALLKARRYSPDVVHIHAVGPALLTPLARLLGFNVVFTNHGPDYDREKWGKTAGFILRLGEKMGGLFASELIVISSVIGDIIKKRCNRKPCLIYNGVSLPIKSKKTDFLQQIGVESGKYIIAIARFVPEKGLHDLVNAFKALNADYKLVIAGDADYETAYSRRLKKKAAEDKKIILTGYITGEPLNQIYTHAKLFILPSYHEGLPIALLEALSYGLPVLVSDIPANREVGLAPHRYFRSRNVDDLKDKMGLLLEEEVSEKEKLWIQQQLQEKYNWDKIADQTIKVYERVCK